MKANGETVDTADLPGSAPPAHVLQGFGLRDEPSRLPGGQGRAWRVGDAVLKPSEVLPGEAEWRAEVFGRLRGEGFRVAPPRRATDGRVVVDGWMAEEWLPGRHERRWGDVIRVGERFHEALRDDPRPAFLDDRTDPWAIGDRVAWDEAPAGAFGTVPHIARLLDARTPLGHPSQLVHGDLTVNILFDDAAPPAVIDFSPYWRPVAFASAIVVADALVWEGADESILETVSHLPAFGQYLIRALIYRAVTEQVFRSSGPSAAGAFRSATDVAVSLLR